MLDLLAKIDRRDSYLERVLPKAVANTQTNHPWCPQTPTPHQQLFLDLDGEEAFFGGAAGGSKSSALLMAALQYVSVPKYAAILFRRTYTDLTLPDALMSRAREWLNGTAARWIDKEKTWKFPSGATLTFGYLESENDKYRYQGSAYTFIAFDELTQFTKTQYLYLFSRLRRLAGVDIPLRMRSASNPGGIGAEWVYERFIPDDFSPEMAETPRVFTKEGLDDRGNATIRYFIPARLQDNPYLDRPSYEHSLDNLDPVTREQLLRGDWQIRHRGDIYWMFDPRYVFVPWSRWKDVFGVAHIPDHWQLTISQDQGTSEGHIGATGWFATAAKNSPLQDLVAMYRALTVIEKAPTEVADAMMVLMGAAPASNEPGNADFKPDGYNDLRPDGHGGHAERVRVKAWLSSHEAKSERLEYAKAPFKFPFLDWTAGPNIGIAQMRDYLRIIETNKPNPFFPELMGRTRFVCVVPDEDWPRRRSASPWARVEAEFSAYHYKQLKSGEPTAEVVPHPFFNDYMDMIKAAAFDSFPRPKPLTQTERIEGQLAPEIQQANIPKIETEEGKAQAQFSHDFWTRELQQREEEERVTKSRFGNIRLPTVPKPVKR